MPAGVEMPPITVEDVQYLEAQLRVPMSFEEYMELPDGIRAEWVEGITIVTPPPLVLHQLTVTFLQAVLQRNLVGVYVLPTVGVRTDARRYREPDLVVVPTDVLAAGRDLIFIETAVIVAIEVLSPSTRTEDRIAKSAEYLKRGIEQYWLVDPAERSITVLQSGAHGWEPIAVLIDDHPTASVEIGEYGTVKLDLTDVLP